MLAGKAARIHTVISQWCRSQRLAKTNTRLLIENELRRRIVSFSGWLDAIHGLPKSSRRDHKRQKA